jgi:hypothetical protein
MPNRILKESICTSEEIEQLTAFQETVFYRLIVNCDDYGRMDARPPILASKLFPLKRSIRDSQIDDALRALTSADLVTVYYVHGKPILQMNTWDRHQTIRAKRPKYPGPAEADGTAPAIAHEPTADDDDLQADASRCKQMQADASRCSRNPNPNPNTNPNLYPNPKENPYRDVEETSRAREADPSVVSVFRSFLEREFKKLSAEQRNMKAGWFKEVLRAFTEYAAHKAEIGQPLDPESAGNVCTTISTLIPPDQWIGYLQMATGGTE